MSKAYYLRRLWWSVFAGGAPLTIGIVGLNVIVFALQLWWRFHLHSTWIDDTFAFSRDGLARGQYWQLLSYAWLHAEVFPLHILFNMMMVLFLGRHLEWPLGPFRFIVLYLGGCLAAAGAWLWWDQPDGDAVIIGASGAVFALVTACAAYDPHQPIKAWLFFIVPLNLTMRSLALLLVISEFMFYHFNWIREVAHTAHLGGALFGWVMMKVWRVRAGSYYPVDGPVTRL